jgi:hypothetical protein
MVIEDVDHSDTSSYWNGATRRKILSNGKHHRTPDWRASAGCGFRGEELPCTDPGQGEEANWGYDDMFWMGANDVPDAAKFQS